MKYVYNEENQELIDKLKNNRLNKTEEKQLIKKFLNVNKISKLDCLFNKYEEDTEQEGSKKIYISTMAKVAILTILLIATGLYSVIYLKTSLNGGLDTTEKVIFALLALVFHLILLADFIYIFKNEILLKNNILNKLRQNL